MKTTALAAMALTLGLALTANGVYAQDRPMKDRAAFTMDSAHMDSKHLIGMKVNTPDGSLAKPVNIPAITAVVESLTPIRA